jgi:hypothetical protein
MALIEFIYAAYIGVAVTILIGIFVEGRRAQLDNVLSNIASFFLLLATTSMPFEVAAGLVIYLGLGMFIVARKKRDLYVLFGSKTYGSISLVILAAENQFFGLVPWITYVDYRSMLIGCIIVVVIVHIIGYAYTHRRRGWGGRGRAKKRKVTSHRPLSGRRRRRK